MLLLTVVQAAKVCPSCGTSWPFTVPKAEFLQAEDDNEPRQSQRASRSKGKKQRANTIVEDEEVGCSNQDELNEHIESQRDSGQARKRNRPHRTNEADRVGLDASQSSSAVSDLRRVTRKSSRLS